MSRILLLRAHGDTALRIFFSMEVIHGQRIFCLYGPVIQASVAK